ncbi:cysteine synthase A [soil metagenome]
MKFDQSGVSVTAWDLVGNAPLVELKSLSEKTGCRIVAKCEFANPGGSIKDRAAKFMIAKAEREGQLKPGGTIVEGTAGNTGIGLAMLAASRGYKSIISMPDNQAAEKYTMLEVLGAEVRKVKPVPFANQDHFYHQARKIAEQTPGAFWANQFENTANAQAHEEGTGRELWEQTGGRIDVFTCSVGTGGTIAGVSRALKSRARNEGRDVRIILADPFGSGLFSYKKTGEIKSTGSSVTEGIGIMRITANFAMAEVDDALQVPDQEMIDMLFHLAKHEGLFVGTSAALNVMSAYRLALAEQGSGKTFATVLCDSGSRYQSKLLSPAWRAEKNLQPKPLPGF